MPFSALLDVSFARLGIRRAGEEPGDALSESGILDLIVVS